MVKKKFLKFNAWAAKRGDGLDDMRARVVADPKMLEAYLHRKNSRRKGRKAIRSQ